MPKTLLMLGQTMEVKMPESCDNIVLLDNYRPHVCGDVFCHACGHEWVGVIIEKSRDIGMECSNCGKMEGYFKYE